MSRRMYDLDNLRVALTALVIFFHTTIAYGAAGSWYLEDVDKSELTVPMILLTIFTAVCQSFFMGLFFFISGFFTPDSLSRKGTAKFLIDRFIRLGLPMLFYLLFLGPTTTYVAYYRHEESYYHFFTTTILRARMPNFGPLWFAEALLYFVVLYAAYQLLLSKKAAGAQPRPFPSHRKLWITAIICGLIAFLVRLIYPTGTGPWELQLGYFPLYILLFVMGTTAKRQGWLEQMPSTLVRRWRRIAYWTIPVLPIGLILTGALEDDIEFAGGFNIQAFLYAMWEPFVCFGICLALLAWFRARWSSASSLFRGLGRSAYTAYVIHPIIVVSFTALFMGSSLAPIIKLFIVGPLSIVICFAISLVIVRIPYVNKVL
ncbi:acyltransferase [Cohnella sp. WQ 127256]|uniref:acyltransferase family protein n=1 Tax=Cohnella sp. WQ 127256 TaxID=2938790 RepID=UPI0021179A3A|nr:acyltransferase [Cohnella sp. WQ 127256]